MRIIDLRINDVCRIQAVHLHPNGESMDLRGKNGNGKTSALNALVMALAGRKFRVPKPVRDGAKKARVRIDMGEYVLEWSETANGSESCVVKDRDGNPISVPPREFLKRLWDSRAMDPLKFMDLDVGMLRELVGLDFAKLDTERDSIFSERTGVNREVKAAEARLAAVPDVAAPDNEISVVDLSAELSQAHAANLSYEEHKREHARSIEAGKAARSSLEAATVEMERCVTKEATARQEWAAMPEPQDTKAIEARMGEVEGTNRLVRQRRDRVRLAGDLEGAQSLSDSLTHRLDTIDETKRKAVADATMPIADLSFGDNQVLYKGRPVDNACSSERLEMSVAIALAFQRELSLMLMPHGALLDSESLARVHKMCDEADPPVQLVIERPNDGEAGDWILFENGAASGPQVVTETT